MRGRKAAQHLYSELFQRLVLLMGQAQTRWVTTSSLLQIGPIWVPFDKEIALKPKWLSGLLHNQPALFTHISYIYKSESWLDYSADNKVGCKKKTQFEK